MLSQSVVVDVPVVESTSPCAQPSATLGVSGAVSMTLVAPTYGRVTEVPAVSVREDGDVPAASLPADRRMDVVDAVSRGAPPLAPRLAFSFPGGSRVLDFLDSGVVSLRVWTEVEVLAEGRVSLALSILEDGMMPS